nr:hypothetical protein BaRGS_031796 [Batillaria attramentaria]
MGVLASDNPDRRTSQQQQRYKSSAAGGGASGGGQGSRHQQRKTWRDGEWQLVPPHRQSGTGLDLGAGPSTGSGTGAGAAHDSAWQRNGREDDRWFQNNPYYTLAELPADDWHEDQDDLRPVSDDDDDRMSVGTPSLSLPVRPGPLSYSQAASPSLGNREDTGARTDSAGLEALTTETMASVQAASAATAGDDAVDTRNDTMNAASVCDDNRQETTDPSLPTHPEDQTQKDTVLTVNSATGGGNRDVTSQDTDATPTCQGEAGGEPLDPPAIEKAMGESPTLCGESPPPVTGSVEPVSSKQPVQGEPGNSMVKPRGRPKDSDLLPEACKTLVIHYRWYQE